MHRFFILLIVLTMCVIPAAKSEALPVRLHVIAQSNEESAQEIKLHVRDEVVKKAREITENAESAQDAYVRLFTSIGEIRSVARKAAEEYGFEGDIEAVVTREHFPARLYGNMILKEGQYPTVLVKIGKAEGKNWWCVIYPDLCLYGERTEGNEIRLYSKFGYWIKRWIGRWSV